MPQRVPTDLEGLAFDEQQETLAAREAREREVADLKWLMSDKRGRRVMHRLLAKAGVFRSSFDGTAETTFFREGERNVGLLFLADVTDHAGDEYLLMLKEARKA